MNPENSNSTENSVLKKQIIFGVAIVGVIILSYFVYDISTINNSVNFVGLTDDATQNQAKIGEIVERDAVTGEVKGKPYTPRTLGGGGSDWAISLLETQPNVFTGKFLYKNGTENYVVLLSEQVSGNLVGTAKNTKVKGEEFDLRIIKENKTCTDSEENTFEYTFGGTFKNTKLIGCGGIGTEKK